MSLRATSTPVATTILNTDGTPFYASSAELALGTLTWTGTTAPSGTIVKNYRWARIGKAVTLTCNINASIAGVAVASLAFDLPADCPLPAAVTGIANNDIQYSGDGMASATTTNIAANNKTPFMVYTGTKWTIGLDNGSIATRTAVLSISYIAA
jgi:hypothetical protein